MHCLIELQIRLLSHAALTNCACSSACNSRRREGPQNDFQHVRPDISGCWTECTKGAHFVRRLGANDECWLSVHCVAAGDAMLCRMHPRQREPLLKLSAILVIQLIIGDQCMRLCGFFDHTSEPTIPQSRLVIVHLHHISLARLSEALHTFWSTLSTQT